TMNSSFRMNIRVFIIVAFSCWLSSMGISVEDISDDMKNGLVILKVWKIVVISEFVLFSRLLLQMMDTISHEIVDWTRVKMQPANAFQMIENCTYGVNLGKQLKFSLIGIGGKDIFEG